MAVSLVARRSLGAARLGYCKHGEAGVPTPDSLLWERDLHTEAKHRLYKRYLQAWYRILLHSFPRGVTYADGFAGPGEYIGGHPGSPVIAVRAALESDPPPTRQKPVYLLFAEKDERRAAHLRGVL
jgi:three-Cys-motif partner protein